MKIDTDAGIFRQISRLRLRKHIRELCLVYDKCPTPMAILDTAGFPIYANPAAVAVWGRELFSKGIGAVCADPWDILTDEMWKDGLPKEINFIGKVNYRKALLTPMVMGGVRLIAFKIVSSSGKGPISIPYTIDPMADWARIEEEIPLEASMADLCLLKGNISDKTFAAINDSYKNIIRQRAGFGTLSTIYRNYGGKREKVVNIVDIIRRVGEETGVIHRITAPVTRNYNVGVEADEGVLVLAVAECVRWLIPYMKRIGDDERIRVKVSFFAGRVKVRFSLSRMKNCPDLVKSSNGKYYFEGLQHIAGVIRTFGGYLESGVSLSEMYLLWDLPMIKAPFEERMSEINDVFSERIISEAMSSVVYAARLYSDK